MSTDEDICTCMPREGCDAAGDPGCRYCQMLNDKESCPADDDLYDPYDDGSHSLSRIAHAMGYKSEER